MTKRILVAAAGAALLGAGAATAIGMAGEGSGGTGGVALAPGYESTEAASTLHRVARPSGRAQASAGAVASAKRKRKPVRIKYFQTQPFPISNGQGLGDALDCPRRHRTLGGYFGVGDAVDVAITYSAPINRRRWFVGLTKFGTATSPPSPATATAVIGLVCAQRVK